VGHLILVMRKTAQLHAEGIVHGDLRFSNIVFSEANDAAVASTIIDFDHSGLAGEKIYPPRFNPDITDGFRHAGARAYEFLRPEHDIAALQWMCAQYRPKNVDLRETWSSCVNELLDGILDVPDRLLVHEFEELEPVDKNMVVSVGGRYLFLDSYQ
jgi:serine/threonine protein kinase